MDGPDQAQLLRGVLDLAVSAVLADQESYGYDVVRRLHAAGLEGIAEASVYGTLRRLFAAGLLTSRVVASDAGPARKYYDLSHDGVLHLERARSEWLHFAGAVTRLVTLEETR